MIHESHYWKDDVSRREGLLRKRLQQTRWSERSTARMEQDLMLGFYSIRKLFESQKLTAALAQARVRLRVHQCRKPVTLLNRHAVHALYDLTEHTEEERDITFLCNQFIHSYVFVLTVSQRHKWEGVLLASDRERNRVGYHVSAREIIRVFAQVSRDHPNRAAMTFNAKRRDYDVHSTNSSEGHIISAIMDDGQADDFSPEAMGLVTQSALCRGLPTIYKTESGKVARGANSGP